MVRAASVFIAVMALTLTNCGGGATLTSDAPPAPDKPSPTDVMDGRWTLAAPNAPSCGVTFTAPSPNAGNVTPDGGCPERFYMSRRWRLIDGTLTIVDADDTALAAFRVNGDRFEGKSENGTSITLSR